MNRRSRRLAAGATVLCCLAAGCARRTDAATRRAFENAARNPDAATGGGGTKDPTLPDASDPDARVVLYGWDRVDQLLDEAVDVMRRSPDDEQLTEIATKWCAQDPDPRPSPDGPVHACFPSPPVNVGQSRFSVELGGPGVIGLVARDLPAAEAKRLVAKAEQQSQRLCKGPWSEVGGSPNGSDAERTQTFRTCPVGGGPILAVGRFALDAAADRWQVSVAIVGTS